MPVRYGSIIDEHRAVRSAAGLFDLSHMGELWVSGPDAAAGLAAALVSVPGRLAVGRAQYSLICAPDGGVIDDLIVYRTAPERFLVVPNASNREVVAAELASRLAGRAVELDDATLTTALLAVQGPAAWAILQPLTNLDLGSLRSYAVAEAAWPASPPWWPAPATRARTASSSSSPGTTVRPPGMPCSWRARATGCCPAASALATRCDWKRACRSTATSSTVAPRPSRPAWPASSTWSAVRTCPAAATSWAVRPWRHAARAAAPPARRPRAARPRHRPPRLRGPASRAAGADRCRHQRQPVAHAGRGHRHGLRSALRRVHGYHARGGRSATRAVAAEVVPLPFYRRTR